MILDHVIFKFLIIYTYDQYNVPTRASKTRDKTYEIYQSARKGDVDHIRDASRGNIRGACVDIRTMFNFKCILKI